MQPNLRHDSLGCRVLTLLQVVGLVGGLGMSWQATFGIILTLYFYSHYFFASGEYPSQPQQRKKAHTAADVPCTRPPVHCMCAGFL